MGEVGVLWDRLTLNVVWGSRELARQGLQEMREGQSSSDCGEAEPREDRGLVHSSGHLATAAPETKSGSAF